MANFTFNNASNQTRTGTNQPDTFTFTGSGSQDSATGLDGSDTFNGNNFAAAGSVGGAVYTDVTLKGGLGTDTFSGLGTAFLVYGNQGNDFVNLNGTGTNTTIYGGQGNDSIGTDSETLANGANGSNYLIYGNKGDDSVDIEFAGGNNRVFGGQGSDTITGSLGTDLLVGGQGNDLIYGQGEGSLIYGDSSGATAAQSGDDLIASIGGTSTVYGGQGSDIVSAQGSANTIYGNQGNDILADFGGTASTPGTQGSSTFYGGQGNDIIATASSLSLGASVSGGVSTDDVIYGNLGNDQIFTGGNGTGTTGDRATVYGGQGDDIIQGNNTQSVLSGGLGNDSFFVAGAAAFSGAAEALTITDFVSGSDRISFGGPPATSNNFSTAQVTGGLQEAEGAAANSGTTYTFVAGSTDGYLFYNNTGGAGPAQEGVVLTGDNNPNGVKFTDIFNGAAPNPPASSLFPSTTDL